MAEPPIAVRRRPQVQVRKPLPWWRPTWKTALHVLLALPMALALWAGVAVIAGVFWDVDLPLPSIPLGIEVSVFEVNPIETVIRFLGDWALRFIILTLAITPLARVLRRPSLVQYRRMCGLWAFAYALVHMSLYLGDHFTQDDKTQRVFFDWGQIGTDISKNYLIISGMCAFVMLVPLAITSTRGWVRRLTYRRWQALHRLVYAVAVCVAFHYLFMVKHRTLETLIYATIIGLLLVLRLWWWWRDRARRVGSPRPAPAPA